MTAPLDPAPLLALFSWTLAYALLLFAAMAHDLQLESLKVYPRLTTRAEGCLFDSSVDFVVRPAY